MQEARREQLDAQAAARMKRKAAETKKVSILNMLLDGMLPGICSLHKLTLCLSQLGRFESSWLTHVEPGVWHCRRRIRTQGWTTSSAKFAMICNSSPELLVRAALSCHFLSASFLRFNPASCMCHLHVSYFKPCTAVCNATSKMCLSVIVRLPHALAVTLHGLCPDSLWCADEEVETI